MIIFLIFIVVFFFDAIFFPALFGPGNFMIANVFLIGFLVGSENRRSILVYGLIGGFLVEILTGDQFGGVTASYLATFLVYLWLQRFFEIKILWSDISTYSLTIKAALITAFLFYFYSWFYILIHSDYAFGRAYIEWLMLFRGNIVFSAMILSLFFVLAFRYIHIKLQIPNRP